MTYPFPDARIIQFAKAPQLGRVKTRMSPALSAAQALDLHCRLARHMLATLVDRPLAPIEVWVGGDDSNGFFTSAAGDYAVHRQIDGGLGDRMHDALATTLRRCRVALLIGSDCPFLTRAHLAQALTWLAQPGCDAVLGPATDGGYVLIGVKQVSETLFAGVEWGSERVLAQTRARCARLGWRWRELAALADIDRPADLTLLAGVNGFWSTVPNSLKSK